ARSTGRGWHSRRPCWASGSPSSASTSGSRWSVVARNSGGGRCGTWRPPWCCHQSRRLQPRRRCAPTSARPAALTGASREGHRHRRSDLDCDPADRRRPRLVGGGDARRHRGGSVSATLIGLTAVTAGTVAVAALLAPPRPTELPTVDTVRRPDADEEWARESTQEFRAIRADLAASARFENGTWRGFSGAFDRLSWLKAELVQRRSWRAAGWTEHLRGRLP